MEKKENSLESFAAALGDKSNMTNAAALGHVAGTAGSVTMNWANLDALYSTKGLHALAIDLPVQDALRALPKIEIPELSPEELEELNYELLRPRDALTGGTSYNLANAQKAFDPVFTSMGNSDLDNVAYARKMIRLFGGGGLIINSDQDFSHEFSVDKVKQGSKLEFIPVTRWELSQKTMDLHSDPVPYMYYSLPIHVTRVLRQNFREAPPLTRRQLQYWGLSALESCISAITSFEAFERLTFELIHEAKIDVYQIAGFNELLGSQHASKMVADRVQIANYLKSFQQALVMDAEDKYSQKTYSFAGLADMYNEQRRNLAAYLHIPMTKLFGESAGGFGSGQDSMENYNAEIVIEQRAIEPLLRPIIYLRCMQKFGIKPSRIKLIWEPMKLLDGVQQEQVFTARQTRIMERFTAGLIDGKEAMEQLRADGVLTLETAVGLGKKKVDALTMAAFNPKTGGSVLGGDKREKERSVQKDNREAR